MNSFSSGRATVSSSLCPIPSGYLIHPLPSSHSLFQVEAFKRPSFSELLDELEDVAESLEPKKDNQLSG